MAVVIVLKVRKGSAVLLKVDPTCLVKIVLPDYHVTGNLRKNEILISNHAIGSKKGLTLPLTCRIQFRLRAPNFLRLTRGNPSMDGSKFDKIRT